MSIRVGDRRPVQVLSVWNGNLPEFIQVQRWPFKNGVIKFARRFQSLGEFGFSKEGIIDIVYSLSRAANRSYQARTDSQADVLEALNDVIEEVERLQEIFSQEFIEEERKLAQEQKRKIEDDCAAFLERNESLTCSVRQSTPLAAKLRRLNRVDADVNRRFNLDCIALKEKILDTIIDDLNEIFEEAFLLANQVANPQPGIQA